MKKYLNYGIALSVLLSGTAMAANLNFVPATGDFSVPGNWDTGIVPGAGDTAAVGGPKVATVTTTETVTTIIMASDGAYIISTNGNLTANAQCLIGNPNVGSLLVDGGALSVTTEFAVGVSGGNTGTLTINSGSITSASIFGVGWAGGTGTLIVNGGAMNLSSVLEIGAFTGGDGDITISGGTVFASDNYRGPFASYTGNLVINDGELSANSLNFGRGGTQIVDLNGGKLIARSGGFLATNTTINIATGAEFIFGTASVVQVDELIDSASAIWNFAETRSVTDNGSGGVIVTSILTPPTEAATIISSSVSNNLMKLVIDAPNAANFYRPEASSDLVTGGWGNIPHSDDGVNPFVVTNLDYSTTDATGTNEVIYLETDQVNKFFKIMGDQP